MRQPLHTSFLWSTHGIGCPCRHGLASQKHIPQLGVMVTVGATGYVIKSKLLVIFSKLQHTSNSIVLCFTCLISSQLVFFNTTLRAKISIVCLHSFIYSIDIFVCTHLCTKYINFNVKMVSKQTYFYTYPAVYWLHTWHQ